LSIYTKLFLKLITDAIGITSPKVKRTRRELEKTKNPVAAGWGRPMDSTSKEPSEDKETPTTKSEARRNEQRKRQALDIHEQYHNDPSKPKTSHDKDIYILTGRKVR